MKHFSKIFILIAVISCKNRMYLPVVQDTENKSAPLYLDRRTFLYEDFPNEDLEFYSLKIEEYFKEGFLRIGRIKNGYKEGAWLIGDAGFDENGNVIKKGHIWKEEYFKKGLRDSIFRQFDSKGQIIYETTFKMGTGLWKEFHNDKNIYFEAYTKDGYFTDTLKLYNEKGELFEKVLYDKDKIVFRQKMIIDDFPTDNK
ncbi:hypothetical protein EH230_10950 [Flavobacterium columnare]|uniref:MORN repeat variant n=1 Tax=Flavobacterium columnare TaxID=996 RepID=A0A437UCN1_9FLAO|nr:hypothetical protein [Flavobacterium columnare]RVU91373.1 hypothetical protein EH230_10950 [Flavobacterium columnare]